MIGISADIFMGLESTLRELKLAQNKIASVGSVPISIRTLQKLDLSENAIVDIPRNAFSGVENLIVLNISNNNHLGPVPSTLIHPLTKLRILDLTNTGLKVLPVDLLAASFDMEILVLKHNALQEIQDGTFANMKNITTIDLSYNNIMSIRPSSFVNVMNIRRLILKSNQLNAFKGEMFNTGTSLEELDISDNHISYLFPSSFRIHPRLRKLNMANNKLNFFPSDLISTLQYLETINLSGNLLKNIDELDFARLPRLRHLHLADNSIEALNEMAFHNSTQLQIVDLSGNKLDRIGERTFEGLLRLEYLNLERNNLTELPDTIFERSKLQMLENINLAWNRFEVAPLRALQRQYFFLSFVDLSHNRIKHIPADDSIMVNIKKLDLSFNPLSKEAITNILGEPKTVRELNLAGTGIDEVSSLETPFLQVLNLSMNGITKINEKIFERATLLENLDLSGNQLQNMKNVSKIWPILNSLQFLDLSNNSFETISHGDLDNLEMLKSLAMTDLPMISRIEKNAFKDLPNLSKLSAYNYPRLGYMDVQGILQFLPSLESVDIEVKDSAVGSEQIQPAEHPRLKEIGIRGDRLKSISPATLAGLKGRSLAINLRNTSLTTLPPALLFPVPRSSHLTVDISGSQITALSPQFLSALEDRRNSLSLMGLRTNPIHCDCNSRALRRWLQMTKVSDLICQWPESLQGKLLVEVGDDELTCDPRKMTTTSSTTTTSTTSTTTEQTTLGTHHPVNYNLNESPARLQTTSEPEIIWSLPPSKPPMKIKTKSPQMKTMPMSNDDTLIIGIVGGVVAFIAILIIIICIVRLRMSSQPSPYRGPMTMGMPPMPMGGPGSVHMSYKGGPPSAIYAVPPYGSQSYATLPHKMSPTGMSQQQLAQNIAQIRPAYSTMGRLSLNYQQQQQHQQQMAAMAAAGQQQQQQQQQLGGPGQQYVIYPPDDKNYR